MLPRLAAFRPDLVLISAGFDAHRRDPLAQINLTEDDFAWATARLMDVADKSAGGRVVSLLEGGYDLVALARSVEAHVSALMGRAARPDVDAARRTRRKPARARSRSLPCRPHGRTI